MQLDQCCFSASNFHPFISERSPSVFNHSLHSRTNQCPSSCDQGSERLLQWKKKKKKEARVKGGMAGLYVMVAADEIAGVDVAVVTVSSDLNGTFAIKGHERPASKGFFPVAETFLLDSQMA